MEKGAHPLRFVLHEHFARHHHFDLRLEHVGVLVSWAVPKGLPEKAGERRLAIAVDDHPLGYLGFEGMIPEGEYGAGVVRIFDRGGYELIERTEDKIVVRLHGQRLDGTYAIIKFKGKESSEKNWLIMRTH